MDIRHPGKMIYLYAGVECLLCWMSVCCVRLIVCVGFVRGGCVVCRKGEGVETSYSEVDLNGWFCRGCGW